MLVQNLLVSQVSPQGWRFLASQSASRALDAIYDYFKFRFSHHLTHAAAKQARFSLVPATSGSRSASIVRRAAQQQQNWPRLIARSSIGAVVSPAPPPLASGRDPSGRTRGAPPQRWPSRRSPPKWPARAPSSGSARWDGLIKRSSINRALARDR